MHDVDPMEHSREERESWKAALRDRWPKLFSRPCEISIGRGWETLVDVLCATAQADADRGSGQPLAIHVKQKWGELRVYFRCHDAPLETAAHARLSGLCDFARQLSVHTCETCGAPGSLLVDGSTWRTACAIHATAGAVLGHRDTTHVLADGRETRP